MTGDGERDEKARLPAGPRISPWVLRVLVGGAAELSVAGRRYRLTLEQAFRLEEVDGGFVFFMGSAATLERRLTTLAGGSLARVELTGDPDRACNPRN